MHVLVESGSIRLKGTQNQMNEPNANTEVEKLDLSSLDVAELKRQELLELFPEVRTEGGKIDFERLKAVLGEMVDAGRERYGMNWPGKAECMRTIQAPSMGTLLPMPDESVDWDTTENVIIEGDNLEVLKLLQKSYLGKIKMIYIDPPYNTLGDFIYPDNYSESLQTYLEYTGQVDSEGRKFGTTTDSDGRVHSKWLNMMYVRLYLARQLLQDTGVLCVSIDDNEVDNMRKLLNEVFGEENFVENLVWKRRYGGGAKEKHLVSIHEYILVYAKNKLALPELFIGMADEQVTRYYKLVDEKSEQLGPYRLQPLEPAASMEDRPNLRFPVPAPDGTEIWPKRQWLWGKDRFFQAIADGMVQFVQRDGQWFVSRKQYLRDPEGNERLTKQLSIIEGIYGQTGTAELEDVLGDPNVFPFPKPSKLIQLLVQIFCPSGGYVLDFFAGSGSTGHAVLAQNVADGQKRPFILAQLPEPTENPKYRSIADITRSRLKGVAAKMRGTDSAQAKLDDSTGGDFGFRSFRLDASNFIPWDGTASNDADQLAKQLKLGIDHTRGDRTPLDLLFEVLLKSWGEPALSLKVGEETIEGVRVFSVAEGAFLICLEEKVSLEFIRALAARKPDRVVMRESAFAGNDQLKTNAVQTFKSQGVTSFKVV
ncbi:MAG: Adenine specific DNA methylase Mod [Armatimonadetes bacterium OLB18]|nr:MAG: Adenine specific DNA methylase Mod [Armatimonadetes bacterium OLB18]